MEFDLYIGEDGAVQHVYDDALADLFDGDGEATVTRASHVEPQGGGWLADMRPVGGPVLGANGEGDGVTMWICDQADRHYLAPFKARADALAAERRWLDSYFSKGGDR